MAAETVDRAIKEYGLEVSAVFPCKTEHIKLMGSHGWRKNLYVELIQHFGLETEVARHLTDTYGDRAWNVCEMADKTGLRWPIHGKRLDPVYPYLEEEVTYVTRREYAQTAVDVIGRRVSFLSAMHDLHKLTLALCLQTRLAFLNSQAALEVLPKVISIMAGELGWNKKRQEKEFVDAKEYLLSMALHPDLYKLSFDDVKQGNLPHRRELGEHRSIELSDPSAGNKAERRQIPVERSGGGT